MDWQRLEAVFQQAADLEGAALEAFLDQACGTDAELRGEVERLLDSDRRSSGFLEDAVAGGLSLLDGQPDLERVGPYRLLEQIGEGGMGVVYLAERDDEEFEQRVAIKLVRAGFGTPTLLDRFRRERQILASLEHPGIARLLDGGTTRHGLPYLVMEYVDGEPVHRFCNSHRLSLRQRLDLFLSICDAIQYAHQSLVIHRDLKPNNILVTGDGSVKLLDFGIAKLLTPDQDSHLTLTRDRALTPGYASPEQVRGEAVGTASDVYSLGVVLYELLAGRPPYDLEGITAGEVERRILEVEPPPLSFTAGRPDSEGGPTPTELARHRGLRPEQLVRRLQGDLDNIAAKALAKERSRRYASADQLAQDLRRHLEGLPVLARRPTLGYRTAKFLRRHRLGVGVAAAFLALILSSAVVFWQQRNQVQRQRDRLLAVNQQTEDLFDYADPNHSRGRDITVLEMLEQGTRQLLDDRQGLDPDIWSSRALTIGKIHRRLGAYEAARPLLQEALDERRKLFGKRSTELVTALEEVAYLELESGFPDRAEVLYREALGALRGRHQEQRASLLSDLARAIFMQDRIDEAEDLWRQALALYLEIRGPDYPDTAIVQYSLGALLAERRRAFDEAEQLTLEALTTLRQHYQTPHLDIAKVQNNLGYIQIQTGRSDMAVATLEEALADRLQLLGKEHRDVAETQNNLATAFQSLDQMPQAIALFEEALRVDRIVVPEDDSRLALRLRNLATAYRTTHRFDVAEELLREAIRIRGPSFSLDLVLASVVAEQERLEEAETLYNRFLTTYGDSTPLARAYFCAGMATLRQLAGRSTEALALLRESIELLGDLPPRRQAMYEQRLADLLIDTGNLDEAAEILRRIEPLQRDLLPERHRGLVFTLIPLGRLALAEDRPEDAIRWLDEALDILLKYGSDTRQIERVRALLAQSLVVQGSE